LEPDAIQLEKAKAVSCCLFCWCLFTGTEAVRFIILQIRIKTAPLPMMMLDHRFSIEMASAEVAAMLGYTPKQMVGMELTGGLACQLTKPCYYVLASLLD
jgi:hypothetical protein